MAIEKIKILGAVLELPAKPHCQFSPFGLFFEVNGLDWQCCLAGSSKTAPRILIFSTAMGAKPSFYLKFIATYAPAFFGYNNPVLARVILIPIVNHIFLYESKSIASNIKSILLTHILGTYYIRVIRIY